MRALKIAAGAGALLLLVMLLALTIVIGTERGTRFAFEQARAYLPEGASVERIEGRLADRLVLHGVAFDTDGLQLSLARLEVVWTPSALLRRQLLLQELSAAQLRVVQRPSEEELAPEPAGPLVLPERIDLPVRARIERAAISDIRLSSAPDAEPVVVDTLELAASFADARLTIERLALGSPLLDLDAAAAVTAAGDYPLQGRFDWTLRVADYPELRGATRLDGTLAALEIEQTLAAPYDARIAATVTELTGGAEQLRLGARAEVQGFDPTILQPDLPLTSVTLALRADGPLDALELSADVTAEGLEEGTLVVSAAARLEPEALLIHELLLTQPTHAGRLEAGGRVGFGDAVAADLSIVWQQLQWPLDGEPLASSPRGELRFEGTPDDYELSLGAELLAFAADWPGRVDVELSAEGGGDGETISARILTLAAAGELRGEALALEARGAYRHEAAAAAPHSANVEALRLTWGGTQLDAEGTFGETADLRWRVNVPDLSSLLEDAGGNLSGTGAITGTLPLPRVRAELEGAALAYAEYALERLAIDADVDLTGEASSSLAVDAEHGVLADLALERLSVRGSGTPGGHRLSAELRSSRGDADLAADGRIAGPLDASADWHLTLTDARLAYPELAPWSLREPAEARISAARVSVDRHCWTSGDAQLCLDAERTAANLEAALDLEGFELGYLEPFLPAGYGVSGTIDATGFVRQEAGGAPTGELELVTEGGEIVVGADESDAVRLGVEPSHARLALLPDRTNADVDLSTERGHVRFRAEMPSFDGSGGDVPVTERTLNGAVTIDIPDLSFVADLVPDLTEVAGAISGNIDLGGTLDSPALTGTIMLEGGAATVPAAGLTLTDLAASVVGRGGDGIEVAASAGSGGGNVTLAGALTLLGDVPNARLEIRGDEFQLSNTRDARLYVTPTLDVTADAARIEVTGEVLIPRAEITPGTSPPAAVTASSDQILLTEESEEEEAAAARELHARVRIALGDAVNFDGYGLTARFAGNVLAVQAPGTPTTATGEINIIDGEYRAYGQGLVVETGNVYFAGGPLTEPALDIRAVRRPQPGILVGAHVVGTLEEPQFTLFSEPAMTQQEQLSYLVLGRSLQEAPAGESSALSQAALAMGLRGGDFLARNIGERLGIDQLSIETGSGEAGAASDPNQAALVAGKYLSPRLYVSYGIGLFDTVNVLRMQYAIADRWRIVTESSSEATGADVVYTIERGR